MERRVNIMSYYDRVALAGLQLKSTPQDVRSLTYVGTKKIIDGALVAIGADGITCTDVVAGTKDFGVVMFQHIGKSGRTDDNKAEAYVNGDSLPVMVQGRIWVKPAKAVTTRGREAKVYFATADTSTMTPTALDGTAISGFMWDTLTNEDGLAIITINNAPA